MKNYIHKIHRGSVLFSLFFVLAFSLPIPAQGHICGYIATLCDFGEDVVNTVVDISEDFVEGVGKSFKELEVVIEGLANVGFSIVEGVGQLVEETLKITSVVIIDPGILLTSIGDLLECPGCVVERAAQELYAQLGATVAAIPAVEAARAAAKRMRRPMPTEIRTSLGYLCSSSYSDRYFFCNGSGDVLASYLNIPYAPADKVPSLSLSNIAIYNGDKIAQALVDILVIHPKDVGDVCLWVHELKHIQQYRNDGLRDFVARYLRQQAQGDPRYENEAHAIEDQCRIDLMET